jgi:hypothetical protein
LFVGPFADMSDRLANASVRMDRPEFEYCVGPVPVLLIVSAAVVARRRGWRPKSRQRFSLDALIVLLLVPVALNTYGAGWSALLKMLPVIRNSSSLLRFFAADLLPFSLAGALALDFLAQAAPAWRTRLTAFCFATVCATVLLPGHSVYGPDGLGTYNPSAMALAWQKLETEADVPAVSRIGIIDPKAGPMDQLIMQRQDGMIHGESHLFCYDPLFGYKLEHFPKGTLHEGGVFEQSGDTLNIKNPACYVFPEANSCKPGH